jgi:uncharacterized Zn-finger protein
MRPRTARQGRIEHKGSQAMTQDAPETEIVSTWRVACDGGEGALGHPRVWLSIPHQTGFVECGYCDKKYIHEDFADASARS